MRGPDPISRALLCAWLVWDKGRSGLVELSQENFEYVAWRARVVVVAAVFALWIAGSLLVQPGKAILLMGGVVLGVVLAVRILAPLVADTTRRAARIDGRKKNGE